MPFFSSLLGQTCWRERPWTTAWYVLLLLQNSFGMQFSAHLLTFGSSWQNKASVPKRTDKTRQWKSEKSGNLGNAISVCYWKIMVPGAVKRCVICALADPLQPGTLLLAADSWRFVLSWLFYDQRKEKVDLSLISHSPASTKERKKHKTGPSLQESFLGEKISMGQCWSHFTYQLT